MMMGTAGFTALQCAFAVKEEKNLLGKKVKDVLVTGATGGVEYSSYDFIQDGIRCTCCNREKR